MERTTLHALHEARASEKGQALFYRTLAAQAAVAGDDRTAERLNELHADEQHHLSRLSARLLELGEALEELGGMRAPEVGLEGWEALARDREQSEVERYTALAAQDLDAATRELVEEILASERRHESELGGKWMRA